MPWIHTPELKEMLQEIAQKSPTLPLQSVYDLQRWSDSQFDEVVPILVSHLSRGYSDIARCQIAGVLARKSKAVQAAWPALVNEFKRPETTIQFPLAQVQRSEVRGPLANALVKSYGNEHFDEMVELITNPKLGPNRYILISAFRRRLGRPEVLQFLESMLDDPDIAPELEHWGIGERNKT